MMSCPLLADSWSLVQLHDLLCEGLLEAIRRTQSCSYSKDKPPAEQASMRLIRRTSTHVPYIFSAGSFFTDYFFRLGFYPRPFSKYPPDFVHRSGVFLSNRPIPFDRLSKNLV
jgi:hypothetical protein